jgi:hypothetical protein
MRIAVIRLPGYTIGLLLKEVERRLRIAVNASIVRRSNRAPRCLF